MSWKYVFNPGWMCFRDIAEAAKAGQNAGYEFMMWNGVVYSISGKIGGEAVHATQFTAGDMQ